ncbi:MAG: translocation protein S66 [Thelocarpon impressellum]|nr:MAG: translocation protein S66 [Thelocarpon impressellum]
MVDWIGLVVPFAYLSILVGSLATFSSLYRKRKAAKATSLEPWFPQHLQRDIYLTLLHLEPEPAPGKEKAPPVPESVLKAALLRRAVEDIHRILQVRNSKQALSSLLQRGSVGDDLWQRFSRAEKEAEEEIRDVVNEANAFVPGWGQTIFQSANEMAANSQLRKRAEEIQAQAEAEKAWWNERRAGIRTEFMKELGEEELPHKKPTASGERGSDEDAVLVEAVAAGSTPAGGKGGAAAKKRKGKK